MTYQEAVAFKEKLHYKTFHDDNKTWTVFVTPENEKDFLEYSIHFIGLNVPNDDLARRYSKNLKFKVQGLVINEDKSKVLRNEDLPS